MVELAGGMSGATVKLAQLADYGEAEFLPEELRPLHERVIQLGEPAPRPDWKATRKLLARELDEPLKEVFDELDEEPVATTATGFVHRGRLQDGREVAVKVQRSGLAEIVRADLQTVGLVAEAAKKLAPRLDARAVAAEIRERVLEGIDYEWVAGQQRRFARLFRGHPFVHVPAAIGDLCRARVLVSEWVDGTDFAGVLELGQPERDRVGEMLVRFYAGTPHRAGVADTDPHRGNVLLLEDGRLAVLDFGSVREVPSARLGSMGELCLAAARRDAPRAAALAVELGALPEPERVDMALLIETAHSAAGPLLEDGEAGVDAKLLRRAVELAARADSGVPAAVAAAALPPEDVMPLRMYGGLIGLLARLEARANWHAIMREYWAGDEPATELGRQEREFFA